MFEQLEVVSVANVIDIASQFSSFIHPNEFREVVGLISLLTNSWN